MTKDYSKEFLVENKTVNLFDDGNAYNERVLKASKKKALENYHHISNIIRLEDRDIPLDKLEIINNKL